MKDVTNNLISFSLKHSFFIHSNNDENAITTLLKWNESTRSVRLQTSDILHVNTKKKNNKLKFCILQMQQKAMKKDVAE